jgi:hypothetical protein
MTTKIPEQNVTVSLEQNESGKYRCKIETKYYKNPSHAYEEMAKELRRILGIVENGAQNDG